jgi:hypothetical protein
MAAIIRQTQRRHLVDDTGQMFENDEPLLEAIFETFAGQGSGLVYLIPRRLGVTR